jgi:sphingosine kinase
MAALKEGMLAQGHSISLTDTEMLYEKHGRREELRLDAIEGASAVGSTLVVHTFPLRTGCCGAPKRTQVDVALPCASTAQADEWQLEVLQSISSRPGPLARRHLMVLVNPHSGMRKARQNLAATRHILTMRGATIEEIETTHAGHAEEIMLTLDLSRYDGLVIVSGDGLMYEVVNGLMKRDDGMEAIGRIPLGIIPSGTGNGLAKSLLSSAGEPYDIVSAALLVSRGGVAPLDLAEITTGIAPTAPGMAERYAGRTLTEQTSWSFLALMWGLVSDIDLESETCRCFGAARFDVYAVLRIMALRRYRGVLRHRMEGRPWTTVEGEFVMVWANNLPWAATDMNIAPNAEQDNGAWECVYVQRATRMQLADGFGKLGSGQVEALQDFVTSVRCSEIELEPEPRDPENPGHVDIDGEEVPFGPVRVAVKKGMARVMCQPVLADDRARVLSV